MSSIRFPFVEPHKKDAEYGVPRKNSQGVVTYIHAGEDWNGAGGGNTDLGYKLYPLKDTNIVHASKSDSGYGNIVVFELFGPWGNWYVRYAHCDDIIKTSGPAKKEEVIATLGHTGNSWGWIGGKNVKVAHLHLDLIVKRPPNDNWRHYAPDQATLEKYFYPFTKWYEQWHDWVEEDNMVDWLKQLFRDIGQDPDNLHEGDVRDFWGKGRGYETLQSDHERAKADIHNLKRQITRRDEKITGLDEEINRQATVIGGLNEDLADCKVDLETCQNQPPTTPPTTPPSEPVFKNQVAQFFYKLAQFAEG